MVSIEPMHAEDFEAVRAIFAEGIATGNATFESEAPDRVGFDARFLPTCRLVARAGEQLAGWAALGAVSSRPAYRGVAEVSVYVAERARRGGVGHALLAALVTCSEEHGFWTLQAGIGWRAGSSGSRENQEAPPPTHIHAPIQGCFGAPCNARRPTSQAFP